MNFLIINSRILSPEASLIRIFTLILMTQISLISKTQNYIPLAVEGAQWIVAIDKVSTPWSVDDLWEHYAEGDTTINGYPYKKVYSRSLVTTQDPPPFTPDGEYVLRGFIRDDTVERKVYAIDLYGSGEDFCPAGEEFLMFDFLVNPDDTIDFCLLPDFEYHVVDTILEGLYFDLETRWYILNWGEPNYYEGIGSFHGLFEPMFTPVKSVNLSPLAHTYLYHYCREAPCGLIVSVPEEQTGQCHFHVFPNPTRGHLNINLISNESDGELRLYSIFGQELMKQKVTISVQDYKLDLSQLSMGNYILTLVQNGVVLERKKIVVTSQVRDL